MPIQKTVTDITSAAEKIVSSPPSISYPSSFEAERVREIMRGLLSIVRAYQSDTGETNGRKTS